MKYRMLKAGDFVRRSDQVKGPDDPCWTKVMGLVGLQLTTPWVGQVRRPIKPKKKLKEKTVTFNVRPLPKCTPGPTKATTDCNHGGHVLYREYTAWCSHCGAISVRGKPWKLPKSAKHPYYPVGP